MRYRKLDANGDYTFGQGNTRGFWQDVPDAVGQAALTRLRLWTGDWFLNLPDGTPYRTQVLGKYTGNTADPAIQARILGTPGVKAILAYASQQDRDTRIFNIQCTLDTIYGVAKIVGPI